MENIFQTDVIGNTNKKHHQTDNMQNALQQKHIEIYNAQCHTNIQKNANCSTFMSIKNTQENNIGNYMSMGEHKHLHKTKNFLFMCNYTPTIMNDMQYMLTFNNLTMILKTTI